MPVRRLSPIVLSGLAVAAAIIAVIVVAALSSVSLNRIFAHLHPHWIVVVAIAQAVSLIPYLLAYRRMTVIAGLRPPRLPVLVGVVLSGFGPFLIGGGSRLDQRALREVSGDHQGARVAVVTLMALEWAVLAPVACVSAIVLLIGGAYVILAYATGYVVTRRSLPLAGATITEVLLTFALHWLGAPLGPALAAVVVYRLFNLVLAAVPSLAANRLLDPALAQ